MALPLRQAQEEVIRVCVPIDGPEPLVRVLGLSQDSIIASAVRLGVMRHPRFAKRDARIRSLWGTMHYTAVASKVGISVGYLYKRVNALGLPVGGISAARILPEPPADGA